MDKLKTPFNYNPNELPRELKKFYISADADEIRAMLSESGLNDEAELFSHIQDDVKMEKEFGLGQALDYHQLAQHMEQLSLKNSPKTSFIGDGLFNYKVPETTPFVCDIRGLTTAYTPYQPERSQGTLQTLWIYSSTMSMLTGFEAINASFYDRSTSLFEALNTATRIHKKSKVVIVSEGIYPGDIEVLQTLSKGTELVIEYAPLDKKSGLLDLDWLTNRLADKENAVAGFAFPQVNSLGLLEKVNELTDLCLENGVQSIAMIDPMLLAKGGLKAPADFGAQGTGCNMIVGEGQHLAIAPNFGGPGLGIFGIRYNQENKLNIRSTAGRFVGKGVDKDGKDAFAMVLSTREQHIRREKATSNICSNEGFLATIAGAGILCRGEDGMEKSCRLGREKAVEMSQRLVQFEGVSLAFNETSFFNEICLKVDRPVKELIELARKDNIHLGVDVTERLSNGEPLIKLSFTDVNTEADLDQLEFFFSKVFKRREVESQAISINENLLRASAPNLPNLSLDEIKKYYTKLGSINVSPDDNIYPLGSCTMKYNPYINDWAASLPGFTDVHPQAPLEDAQGCMEILYEIQEQFKAITGLPALTTQPVAGAQGELVGIKMFQAYHQDKGNGELKDIILIPASAHGTNPATATMAGYLSKTVDGKKSGIITIKANQFGEMDFDHLKELVAEYGQRISGIMVTNPNTSGVFETKFKEMSELIHSVDGLVYMDGANMNAIAGWVDLDKLGVDAVHSNLHKTWTIPHGGGGPGDAIVAVSSKLIPFLPGKTVEKVDGQFVFKTEEKSIGSFHRHYGNFAHKIRAYTYIKALGDEGVRKMSSVAVLSARYLYQKVKAVYPSLPAGADDQPRMHEFIITFSKEDFDHMAAAGTAKAQAIAKVGKLFLDFGMHAPTVAFPEPFGLMVEPTESFTKAELDRFFEVLKAIKGIVKERPEVLTTVPHFTPVKKVDEVRANKELKLWEPILELPNIPENILEPAMLNSMTVENIIGEIFKAHEALA